MEVETGASDIRHNVESHLKAGFSNVLSVPANVCVEGKTFFSDLEKLARRCGSGDGLFLRRPARQ